MEHFCLLLHDKVNIKILYILRILHTIHEVTYICLNIVQLHINLHLSLLTTCKYFNLIENNNYQVVWTIALNIFTYFGGFTAFGIMAWEWPLDARFLSKLPPPI